MANTELLILKGYISDMPESDKAKIKECADKIRADIAEYGDHGIIALTLVGAEMSDG